MTKHPSYRARDQPESGSASQHRKDKIMHKFEKRDAKSRTLVILAVVGLAAALTVGIFTAVRMFHKPAQSKDDPKTGIVYDDSAIEGGWDNLSPEEIAENSSLGMVQMYYFPAKTANAKYAICLLYTSPSPRDTR